VKLAELGKSSLLYTISNLLVRGIQILLIPFYTQALGTGQYGIIEMVAVCGGLVNLTVALEISQGMARYLADTDNIKEKMAYAGTAILFSAFAYSLFAVVAYFGIDYINLYLFSNHATPDDLKLAVLAIATNGIFMILLELLRWEIKPLSYLFASTTYAISCLISGLWLVYIQQVGVSGVFAGQLIGASLAGTIAFVRSQKLIGSDVGLMYLMRMLSFSAPLTISSFAVFLTLFADRLIVREALGLEALGVYGFAARISSIVSIATLGLQSALTPLVYKSWKLPETAEKLGFVTKAYLVLMTPFIISIAVFAPELTRLLSGVAFLEARLILPILTLSALLSSLYIFSPGLFLGKKTSMIAALNVAGATLNLAVSSWLTPKYGIIAAASSTLLSSSAILFLYIQLGQQYFAVKYDWSRLAGLLLVILFYIFLSLQLQDITLINGLWFIIVKLIVLIVTSMLIVKFCLTSSEKTRILSAIGAHMPFIRRGNHQK